MKDFATDTVVAIGLRMADLQARKLVELDLTADHFDHCSLGTKFDLAAKLV